MELIKVLKQPIISEKSFASADKDQYVFLVEKNATKIEVAQAVKKAFKVHVINVNTITIKGKVKIFGRVL